MGVADSTSTRLLLMPENPVRVLIDRVAGITEAMRKLANTQVMVGIPSDAERSSTGATGTDKRKEPTINNATIGYIMETGSPINNVPARPFLAPGVAESKSQWLPYLEQAGRAAFDDKPDVADRAFHAAGLTAVSAVKRKIQAGIPPPLSQRTIEGRQRRRKGRKTSSAVDTTPLIDTGQFLASITYVLRKRK